MTSCVVHEDLSAFVAAFFLVPFFIGAIVTLLLLLFLPLKCKPIWKLARRRQHCIDCAKKAETVSRLNWDDYGLTYDYPPASTASTNKVAPETIPNGEAAPHDDEDDSEALSGGNDTASSTTYTEMTELRVLYSLQPEPLATANHTAATSPSTGQTGSMHEIARLLQFSLSGALAGQQHSRGLDGLEARLLNQHWKLNRLLDRDMRESRLTGQMRLSVTAFNALLAKSRVEPELYRDLTDTFKLRHNMRVDRYNQTVKQWVDEFEAGEAAGASKRSKPGAADLTPDEQHQQNVRAFEDRLAKQSDALLNSLIKEEANELELLVRSRLAGAGGGGGGDGEAGADDDDDKTVGEILAQFREGEASLENVLNEERERRTAALRARLTQRRLDAEHSRLHNGTSAAAAGDGGADDDGAAGDIETGSAAQLVAERDHMEQSLREVMLAGGLVTEQEVGRVMTQYEADLRALLGQTNGEREKQRARLATRMQERRQERLARLDDKWEERKRRDQLDLEAAVNKAAAAGGGGGAVGTGVTTEVRSIAADFAEKATQREQIEAELDAEELELMRQNEATAERNLADSLVQARGELRDRLVAMRTSDEAAGGGQQQQVAPVDRYELNDRVNKVMQAVSHATDTFAREQQAARDLQLVRLRRRLAESEEQRATSQHAFAQRQIDPQLQRSDRVLDRTMAHQLLLSSDDADAIKDTIVAQHDKSKDNLRQHLSQAKQRQLDDRDRRLAERRAARLGKLQAEMDAVDATEGGGGGAVARLNKFQAGSSSAQASAEKKRRELDAKLQAEQTRLEREQVELLRSLESELQAEVKDSIQQKENTLSSLIGRQQMAKARRQRILEKQKQEVAELKEQLLQRQKEQKERRGVDDENVDEDEDNRGQYAPEKQLDLDQTLKRHENEIEALEKRFMDQKNGLKRKIEERLERKLAEKERARDEKLHEDYERRSENFRKAGLDERSQEVLRANLEVEQERAKRDGELERQIEMQAAHDDLKRQMEEEVLSRERKLLGKLAKITGKPLQELDGKKEPRNGRNGAASPFADELLGGDEDDEARAANDSAKKRKKKQKSSRRLDRVDDGEDELRDKENAAY